MYSSVTVRNNAQRNTKHQSPLQLDKVLHNGHNVTKYTRWHKTAWQRTEQKGSHKPRRVLPLSVHQTDRTVRRVRLIGDDSVDQSTATATGDSASGLVGVDWRRRCDTGSAVTSADSATCTALDTSATPGLRSSRRRHWLSVSSHDFHTDVEEPPLRGYTRRNVETAHNSELSPRSHRHRQSASSATSRPSG